MLVDNIATVAKGLDRNGKLLFMAQILDAVDVIQQEVLDGDECFEVHEMLQNMVDDFEFMAVHNG